MEEITTILKSDSIKELVDIYEPIYKSVYHTLLPKKSPDKYLYYYKLEELLFRLLIHKILRLDTTKLLTDIQYIETAPSEFLREESNANSYYPYKQQIRNLVDDNLYYNYKLPKLSIETTMAFRTCLYELGVPTETLSQICSLVANWETPDIAKLMIIFLAEQYSLVEIINLGNLELLKEMLDALLNTVISGGTLSKLEYSYELYVVMLHLSGKDLISLIALLNREENALCLQK